MIAVLLKFFKIKNRESTKMSIAISLTENEPILIDAMKNESLFQDSRHYYQSSNRLIDEFMKV